MKSAKQLKIILFVAVVVALSGCARHSGNEKNGKLFIIGGGTRSDVMMNELIDLAGIRTAGYAYILPMASSGPDSAIMWTKDDFHAIGIKNVFGYNFKPGENPKPQLDSLLNAKLIFISGGDQTRFMSVVMNSPVMEALMQAHKNGAVISGTSAGAAVMSKKMITGNQKKHTESTAGFTSIESDNVEITRGLGFLSDVIVDQHFIKRQRLNRLVSVSIENPAELCVGIDESTAIIVDGDIATVTGVSQVVVIKNTHKEKNIKDGLLGTEGLQLSVYYPGQKFHLR
jgi:cyanophycinase